MAGDGKKTDPSVTKSAGGATGYFELHPDTLGYVLGLGENLRRYYYYYYHAPQLLLAREAPPGSSTSPLQERDVARQPHAPAEVQEKKSSG